MKSSLNLIRKYTTTEAINNNNNNKLDIDEIMIFKKDCNNDSNDDSDDETVNLSTLSSSLSLVSSSSKSTLSSNSSGNRITRDMCKQLNFYQKKHLYSISNDSYNINNNNNNNNSNSNSNNNNNNNNNTKMNHDCDPNCNDEFCYSCENVSNAPTPASSPTRQLYSKSDI